MATAVTAENDSRPQENVEVPGLSEFESEVIELFVRMAQLVGVPKSVGQIYGLIFASPTSINSDELVSRLGISKGSTSQGLRFLRSVGAVNVVSVPGQRSDHYEPETGLRRLASGFLKEQIEPHLDSGMDRLARLKDLSADPALPENEVLRERVGRLETWHNRAIKLLPLLLRFLGR